MLFKGAAYAQWALHSTFAVHTQDSRVLYGQHIHVQVHRVLKVTVVPINPNTVKKCVTSMLNNTINTIQMQI